MKIRTAIVLSCLTGVVVLSIGYQYCWAEPKADTPSAKIGVVSVRKVVRDCKVGARYRAEILAEQSRIKAEDEKLSKDIQAREAGLNALKPGSSDHLVEVKEVLEKRADLSALREFNNRQRVLKEQRLTEDIYKETLRITKELAEQKGLALVLEVDEPKFPIVRADELVMILSTHKVLYSAGCLDLTAEVTARLDAQN